MSEWSYSFGINQTRMDWLLQMVLGEWDGHVGWKERRKSRKEEEREDGNEILVMLF